LDHGKKVTDKQLADRARTEGHQIGKFFDNDAAAEFIGNASSNKNARDIQPSLPNNLKTKVVLPDGTEVVADSVRIVIKPDGSIRTSYPFSSLHPN